MPTTSHFVGILRSPRTVRVGDYVLEPRDEHAAIVEALERVSDGEGMIHAPRIVPHLVRTDGTEVPNGQPRPGYFFQLEPTHLIRRADRGPLPADFEVAEGRATVWAVGFLLRARLMLEHWYFDYRAPLRDKPVFAPISDPELGEAATRVLEFFRGLPPDPPKKRKRFLNVLWMKARGDCVYTWAWEPFITEYAILDALWRVGVEERGVPERVNGKKVGHGQRIQVLADAMSLHRCTREEAWIQRLVRARNDLFHEALFEAVDPKKDDVAHSNNPQLYHRLSGLTDRLLLRLCGVEPDVLRGFATSAWGH